MLQFLFFTSTILFITTPTFAAPKKSKPAEEAPSYQDRLAADKDKMYQEGKALSDAGNFSEALDIFTDASKKYPADPDILNMLAYCQRKTGKVDEAIMNYQKAL